MTQNWHVQISTKAGHITYASKNHYFYPGKVCDMHIPWNYVIAVQANKTLMKLILGAGCQYIEVLNLHPCVWRKQFVSPFSLGLYMGKVSVAYHKIKNGVF
jgi:hypothetical protein